MRISVIVLLAALAASAAGGEPWPGTEFRPGALYAARFSFVPSTDLTDGVVNFNAKGLLLNTPTLKNVRALTTNRFVRVFGAFGDGTAWQESPRIGRWKIAGDLSFSDMSVVEVEPEYTVSAGVSLGDGEMLVGNTYRFMSDYAGRASTADRTFHSAGKGYFHDPRWRFQGGGWIVFRHAPEGRSMLRGEIEIVAENAPDGYRVAVSSDGASWREVAAFPNGVRRGRAALPGDLFPCRVLFVRVCGSPSSGFHLVSHALTAEVDGESTYAIGRTSWREKASGAPVDFPGAAELPAARGFLLPGDRAGGTRLWTCDSGWKVMHDTPAPERGARAMTLRLAANETEAVQFVIRPHAAMAAPQWRVSGLSDGNGNSIGAENIDVRRVGYVPVAVPTDRTSRAGLWPDPLFTPLDAPEPLRPGVNQPYWVRVKAPKGTAPGVYRGHVVSGPLSIPLAVEVFGFELPDAMTCETAFAVRHYQIVKYQQTGKRTREAVGRYLKSLSDHRLCAYDPDPFTRLDCVWENADDPSRAKPVFNWAEWDAKIERSFAEQHYTTISLPQLGTIGGGTYEARWPGKILSWTAGTPEYDGLFARFWSEIDRHLSEKGWADRAYVYWFDEPREKDYAFVAEGFARLKAHAPHVRRMITCGCKPGLMDGVNHWCPLTPSLHKDCEADARARGDKFWWYVCTGPKSPYANLFIDKPGTEPRVLLWQTWGEKVSGLLFWNTVYWTGRSVYGRILQNPYLDPQSWDDNAPHPWGNGDGRLFYPPRACFAADGMACAGGGPVIADPVETIRLELLRDGIEDYEYFAMLRRLDPSSDLLDVPADVYASLTEFTDDPEPMARHRVRLARRIAALSAGKPSASGK